MSQKQISENNVARKKVPIYKDKDKRGAFVATILSGVIISAFVVYCSVLEEESDSLQLIIAVSKIRIK